MCKGSGLANSDGALLGLSGVRSFLAAGFQALEARKQEINDLNVYPVPDGDTGTNLALTLCGVLDAVARLPEDVTERELCGAVSQAALMGARGNSGVILSQIVRGAMEVLGEDGPITAMTLSRAFTNASDTAYRAVRRPVEGTMLTVLREMAEAGAAIRTDLDTKAFMDVVIAAGWKSVEKTPRLLRVLADAGVVDAGGYGLMVLVEGAANGRGDWPTPIATRIGQTRRLPGAGGDEMEADEESKFTYCVSFLVSGEALDQTFLEEGASKLGDSLLVVGDSAQLKVHVHSDEPGEVLKLGTCLGILSEIEIDNMKMQTAARSERLAQAAATASLDAGLTQVVAVVAGEGNKQLFRSLGVDLIVEGGQSMNPSAEDILRAVERAVAPSVVILPNNGNVIMTAEQSLGLTGRDVHVVPSRSIPAGLSAAVSFDKRASAAANAKEMRDALERVATGEVTRAVRRSQVDGLKIKADDFIGLVDDQVMVASRDVETVIDGVISRLLEGDREMLTVLLGEGESAVRAGAAVERARGRYPNVEIDIHEGGQPHYPALLAAE
jgi:DAK2 domain fusion protein YloV